VLCVKLQLSGCLLLGVGIWVLVKPSVINYLNVVAVDVSDPLIQHAAVLFIVVGAVVFIVGFVGCCGAYRENERLLLLVSVQ